MKRWLSSYYYMLQNYVTDTEIYLIKLWHITEQNVPWWQKHSPALLNSFSKFLWSGIMNKTFHIQYDNQYSSSEVVIVIILTLYLQWQC